MLPFLSIGSLNIPSYGMCIVFGIILASLWVKIDPHWKDIDFDFFILISACIFGTGFLGAKIAFILVSFPFSFQAFLSSFSAPGGFVFYGGLLGGALGYLIGIKISRQRNADYIKIYAVLIPFCHAFGRIGCYLAGCCYGKPYSGFLAIPSENVAFGRPEDIYLFFYIEIPAKPHGELRSKERQPVFHLPFSLFANPLYPGIFPGRFRPRDSFLRAVHFASRQPNTIYSVILLHSFQNLAGTLCGKTVSVL